MDKSKICAIFEYEFRWGTNASETARKFNSVFGEDSTSHSIVSFWFAKFHSGDFSLENEPRGRPQPKVNNDELKAIVEIDTFQTTRELASKFSVSIPTMLDHLRQSNKVKKLDIWVMHKLNAHQIKKRFNACVSLLSRNKEEYFLHRIFTCDEKWILYDNRKRSANWLDKDETRKHSPKPNIHQKKFMVTTW